MGVDSQLRDRIRSGDQAAFAAVFDEHSRVIYAHAARTTGDRALAEDVMSLTFLEAWRQRDKLRKDVRNIRAWLLGIATNVLRNTARSARRHRAAMARLPPAEPMPDFSEAVVGQMVDSQRLAAATRALNRLKRGEREVFALVVWSGLGYADAAEALGVPTGTVRSRLSRTREKLRRLTTEELDNPQRPESRAGQERTSADRTPQGRPFRGRNAS
ncbi:RNA polymerase sigma factor [Streptomyces uncialis]|uniref:RNA polymerase n=1 Tax=Streptomyces uncialis TaxID=1048205 RepID=A0A1Q4VBN3_9ACTN|nr:RNA polymerase sigma factor [Streptomyces uncialis]MCX4658573.1 RNA polymerase sigma factor [Streptomyces uncialis]OKH95258.1 RNA polymerase [Streptomyces uncialis]